MGAPANSLRLKSAVLQNTKLVKCSLVQTIVEKLQLQDCVIESCNLTAGHFAEASWHVVNLINTRASGMQLQNSLLKHVIFKNCKLDVVNLRFAKLENVVFESCVVTDLDLYKSQLKNVQFIDCDLIGLEFSEAHLQNVDLTRSRLVSIKGLRGLKGATISSEQLMQLAPALAQEIGLLVQE